MFKKLLHILQYKHSFAFLALVASSLHVHAQPAGQGKLSIPNITAADVGKMIDCDVEPREYTGFAMNFIDNQFPKKLGWKKIKQSNPLLAEYALPWPVVIEGLATSRIAFTSSGILAILDNANAAEMSDKLSLKVVVNQPGKFMAHRVLHTRAEESDGIKIKRTISKNVSTVTSHPGKTFVGCSYRIDVD